MRPSGQVALDLGPPYEDGARSDSDFEEIPHPANHNGYWTQHPPAHAPPREEELPLHYMNQENARRRVTRGPGGNDGGGLSQFSEKEGLDYYANDDEGKDVYSKMKAARGPISSGRPRRPPPPPPTTVVRLQPAHMRTGSASTNNASAWDAPLSISVEIARVLPAKPRAYPSNRVHPPLVLDALPQHRQVQCRRLGRGPLWQVRLALHQARVLLRRPPSSRQDSRRLRWPLSWVRWLVRLRERRRVPGECALRRYARHPRDVRCCARATWVVHGSGAWDVLDGMPLGCFDGTLR